MSGAGRRLPLLCKDFGRSLQSWPPRSRLSSPLSGTLRTRTVALAGTTVVHYHRRHVIFPLLLSWSLAHCAPSTSFRFTPDFFLCDRLNVKYRQPTRTTVYLMSSTAIIISQSLATKTPLQPLRPNRAWSSKTHLERTRPRIKTGRVFA